MSNDQSKIEKGYLWIKEYISILLSFGIAILFCLFILVMGFSYVACIFMDFTGTADKTKLLEFIGWVMSGFIATLGVVGLLKRTAALDEQNKLTKKGHAQERDKSDEQNKQAEKGHIHDRFKAASEHLGNVESVSGRIASFHEFCRLAEITATMPEEKGLKETIFDILCAHLRQTTKEKDYKDNLNPTEEVQSLLDILFKPKNGDILIFSGLKANLAEAHLQGADLKKANLQDAKMYGVNLQDSDLEEANLQGTLLRRRYRKEEVTKRVDMQQANLRGANLVAAEINEATTVMPDNWKSVVKLYDYEGRKTPLVMVITREGNERRY